MRSINFIDSGERTLVIDRQKTNMFELPRSGSPGFVPMDQHELWTKESMRMTEGQIQGVLGTMNILGQNYLCVVKESQMVGKIYGSEIYKITDIKLIPFYVILSYLLISTLLR